MKIPLWFRRAKLVRVLDGDTIQVDIQLGFNVSKVETVRMKGINAPEIHSKNAAEKAAGNQSMSRLFNLVKDKDLLLLTIKDKSEKYGRLLATVYPVLSDDGSSVDYDPKSINQIMIDEGLAKVYSGGKRT